MRRRGVLIRECSKKVYQGVQGVSRPGKVCPRIAVQSAVYSSANSAPSSAAGSAGGLGTNLGAVVKGFGFINLAHC